MNPLKPGYQEALSIGQTLARKRMRAGDGFIYAASLSPERVKIGFSLKPEDRVRAFGPAASMIRFTPGTRPQEVALHRALRSHAVDPECYPPSILDHPLIPAGLRAPGRDWLIVGSVSAA